MSENDSKPVTYLPIENAVGYRVGDDGSVWSCLRVVRCECGFESTIGEEWIKLKPYPGKHGHLRITIYRDGVRFNPHVHHLVLEAFVGPCPKGMVCRHFPDINPANNRLANLQWGTYSENTADKIIHGTMPYGRAQVNAKLSDELVIDIRRRVANGESQRGIARELGVDRKTVHNAAKGKTWKHVK